MTTSITPPNAALCPRCGAFLAIGRGCSRCEGPRQPLGETVPRLLVTAGPGGDMNLGDVLAARTSLEPGEPELPRDFVAETRAQALARVGEVLDGRYRLDALLGIGGFGAVYTGTHLELDEPVAIKLLHAEFAHDPALRSRLRREAKALARLRNPNIVALLDFGEQGATSYLVMELVRGVTLESQLLVQGATMPLSRIFAVFDQLLHALAAAHAEGIIHRDLKPENVLLVASEGAEVVKILDFGLALMHERESDTRLTATGIIQGTPLYMSPEQCRGREVGPSADLYAVGVMLFTCLTGETPFTADSATDLFVKHMFLDPPAMSKRGVHQAVPPGIEALVRRALDKNPEARPSAADMRAALAQAFTGRDATSRAAQSQAQRQAHAHQSRSERGLPLVSWKMVEDASAVLGENDCLVLWDLAQARAEALGTALAVHGLRTVRLHGEGPPGPEFEGRKIRALVLTGPDALLRLGRLRASPATAKLPVLVIDVADIAQTSLLIRAGANDVGLALVGDEALCHKLLRILRRGR